jgi:hypothetical protein
MTQSKDERQWNRRNRFEMICGKCMHLVPSYQSEGATRLATHNRAGEVGETARPYRPGSECLGTYLPMLATMPELFVQM